MLPHKFRLSKKEFQQVLRQGRLISGRSLGVLTIKSSRPRDDRPRFPKAGLIVSKRLSKKAVERNRLKRRIRTGLQKVLPKVSPELNLVVLPNKRAMEATVQELESELKKIIFRA